MSFLQYVVVIYDEESLMLIVQNSQFDGVTLGPGQLWWAFVDLAIIRWILKMICKLTSKQNNHKLQF